MYYRKSMLDAAGLTVPKTWDEFAAAAKKLTSGNAKGAFFGNGMVVFDRAFMVGASQGSATLEGPERRDTRLLPGEEATLLFSQPGIETGF